LNIYEFKRNGKEIHSCKDYKISATKIPYKNVEGKDINISNENVLGVPFKCLEDGDV